MTKKEIKKQKLLITECIEQYHNINNLFGKLDQIFGCCPESSLFDGVYKLYDKYVKLTEELTNDNSEWIKWFIYDNDCGKNNFEVEWTVEGKKIKRKIKTIQQLINIINEK